METNKKKLDFTITDIVDNNDGTCTVYLDNISQEFIDLFKRSEGLKRFSQKRFNKFISEGLKRYLKLLKKEDE